MDKKKGLKFFLNDYSYFIIHENISDDLPVKLDLFFLVQDTKHVHSVLRQIVQLKNILQSLAFFGLEYI